MYIYVRLVYVISEIILLQKENFVVYYLFSEK